MPAFPTAYARLALNPSEDRASVVMRSEMERGVPQQRRIASDAMVAVSCTLYFATQANATAFMSWFDGQAGSGALFFDWTHPRTGATVQARFVGGQLGPLTPSHGTYKRGHCQRTAVIEYLEPAYT